MEKKFPNEYFPASIYIRRRYEILNFNQKEGESLSNTYNPGWKNHLNFAWKDQHQQTPQKAE